MLSLESLAETDARIRALHDHAIRSEAVSEAATKRLALFSQETEEAITKAQRISDAQDLLAACAESARSEGAKKVERLVTGALRAVFGRQDYRFGFEWSVKRGQAAAVPVIESTHGGEKIRAEVLDGHGGGIADVVAFVLRFVVALYAQPRLAPLMILDEPFRHVSEEHAQGLGQLLRYLSDKTGWRFVIVTHQRRLAEQAHKAYRAELSPDGDTTLEEIDIDEGSAPEAD